MSQMPSAPADARSPFPLQADAVADRTEAKRELAQRSAANLHVEPASRKLGLVAGATIGSAAIVAALIFYNRSKA